MNITICNEKDACIVKNIYKIFAKKMLNYDF